LPVVVGEIERSLIRHLSNHTCSVRSAVRSARVETPVASGRAFRSELRRAGQMLTTRQHYPASGSGHQPSTVGPSSSPRLRLRATRRVPPRLCRRSTITTARQSMPGTRAGDLVALNAPGRVRTPPGAPVSPRAPRRPSVFSDLRRRESHNALPEGSPGAADLPNALRPARALPPWPPSYQRQRRFPSVTLEVAAVLFAPARCPPGATVDLARRCGAAESRGRSTRPRGRLPGSQPAMPPGSPSTARGWRRRPDARSRR
jgi:hypothetical protein